MTSCLFHKEESNQIPVDQLGQKLLKKKGVSWNKKYRKQYGPLRKVIHEILVGSPSSKKFYYDQWSCELLCRMKFKLGGNIISVFV